MKTMLMCLVASFLVNANGAESTGFSKASIYYIPFQIETYIPVTQDNIKERAMHRIDLTDGKSIAALFAIISGGDKTTGFDEKNVRLLVVWDDGKQKTMVDAKGDVFDGKTRHALGKADFDKLQKLLAGLVESKSTPKK